MLSNENLTAGQKVNEINNLLLQSGLSPKNFSVSENGLQNLEAVETALKEVKLTPNVDSWAQKDFNLNNLANQATLPIDITNKPFNTPKVVMDVKNAEVTKPEDLRDTVENSANTVLDKIIEYGKIIDIARGKYITESGSVVEDTNFTDVLDNDVLDKNPKGWINKTANLNKIKKLFKKRIPPTVNSYHGKDFFQDLRNLIDKYESLQAKKTNLSDEIKEKARNKQNQDC